MKLKLDDGRIVQDNEALDVLRHSAAHLLAEAVLELYKDAKLGFGPTIEDGFYYDIDFATPINDEDLLLIEQKMHELQKKHEKIIRKVISRKEAREIFKENPYKLELIEEIEEPISIYTQGNFVDLCRGPHLFDTEPIKHFKLLNLAGAYWRGDSNNKQLTRIYGTAFFKQEDLDNYLVLLEERKRRDHRILGRQLGLFMISEYGPGFPFWLPIGVILRNLLENYWYDIHEKAGYYFIKTPIMLSKELWEISGHWSHYHNNMFLSEVDDKEYAIKPMNCPGSLLVYKNDLHSYRDFPLRMGELGLVHRYEASGALSGLFRVRTFTQDDAHIFCTIDQLISEISNLLKLFDETYTLFGLDYHIELSTKPEKDYIGSEEIWNKSEKILEEACKKSGKEFKINPGDGAFYGPKLDFKLRDALGRIWQCGTIQLDMNLPERFDITYIDDKGEKARPVMLHRALFGSIERFIGILIEHFAGVFPMWLAPVQISVLPVNNEFHDEYAKKIVSKMKEKGLRVKLDNANEKLGYRLRNSQMQKIPYTIVIGDNEVKDNTVTYRKFGHKEQTTVSLEDFLKLVQKEIDSKSLL